MLHQPFVFWIFHHVPLLYLLHTEWNPIDLKRRGHRIGRLLKNEPLQLPDIIFNSRLHVKPNPAYLLNQIFPVVFHGPPPAVAVRPWVIDVANIVHQHAPEQHADRSRVKAKRLRPLVPELELHPDPVLVLRQAPFCRFVINANQDRAFLTAVINRDSGPPVLKLLFYPGFAKFAHKLLFPVLVVTVAEKLLDIQDTGMIIKGHVQPGDVVPLPLLKEPEEPIEIPSPVLLETPASLAGHIQTGPHSGVSIVQDRDAGEVEPLAVSIPSMAQLVPAAAFHPQQLHPGLRVLLLAAYCQPIIENDIL